ncbi:putative necrosis-inducing factor-domain-containing protein [Neurospora hispaniola]|uniref:Necrosis-inducing factor-domain-containing protein n=1 Tax=Neurospora hispaniola TaxID=588809 RepID=A0AAJ0I4P7_9PEZI|nr:putative necrosis-inducing factor-domain-containing protein [Neurospora hispaniola]
MQLQTNLLTFLLTTSSFLSLITATPIATPSKQSASKTNPINSSIPADDPNTNHIHTESESDPSDPAIAFFSSLPPPSSPPNISPNPSSPTTTGLVRPSKRSSGNKDHCRGGGYFNATSAGSPLVDDCKVIIQNISPRGGTWHYMSGTQRTLVSHGSCALGIESTPDVPKGLQTLVGDLDISEWIQKSIDKYQWKGRVGSYGDTQCVSQTFKGDEYTLRWGLYHS